MFNSRDIVQKTYFGQNLTFQSAPVTLKIRSRSPKSDQPFPFSQKCIHASLVKIHQLVQKITHGNHVLDFSKCRCDLIHSSLFPTIYLCKFDHNTSACSADNAWKPYFGCFKVVLWPWKLGQGHQNLINSSAHPNNASMQVWSKSIH